MGVETIRRGFAHPSFYLECDSEEWILTVCTAKNEVKKVIPTAKYSCTEIQSSYYFSVPDGHGDVYYVDLFNALNNEGFNFAVIKEKHYAVYLGTVKQGVFKTAKTLLYQGKLLGES